MKHSHRITKYDPAKERHNEWTSISDIRDLILYQDYLKTETAYINTVIEICHITNNKYLTINSLETRDDAIVDKYTDGEKMDVLHIDSLIRNILREKVWCKLISEAIEFHFGYDYYMYVVSDQNFKDALNTELYVEIFESPYRVIQD